MKVAYYFFVKPLFVLGLFCLLPFSSIQADSGFFGAPDATFIIYDVGSGNVFTDAETTLSGSPIDLGTLPSFILNGGEVKTFKNGADDITATRIMYRIYETGSVSGAFIPISLFHFENCNTGAGSFPSGGACGNAGDQKWRTSGHNVDVLAGLDPLTDYTLEFYFEADYNTGGPTMTLFRSNFGVNYAFNFTSPAPIPALSEWGGFLFFLTILILGLVGFMNVQSQKTLATPYQKVNLSSNLHLPFDRRGFSQSLKIALSIVPFGFAFIYLGWGEIIVDDFIGMFFAIPIVAYLIYLLKLEE